MKKTIFEKLEDKTLYSPDGCWYWLGSTSTPGYGQIQYKGVKDAHRVSYFVHKGTIPEGMFICHTCNNRRCINPDHLYAGTRCDNRRDMTRSGVIHGERNVNALLTNDAVKDIRTSTDKVKVLARKYGVKLSTIRNVIYKKAWNHVL